MHSLARTTYTLRLQAAIITQKQATALSESCCRIDSAVNKVYSLRNHSIYGDAYIVAIGSMQTRRDVHYQYQLAIKGPEVVISTNRTHSALVVQVVVLRKICP